MKDSDLIEAVIVLAKKYQAVEVSNNQPPTLKGFIGDMESLQQRFLTKEKATA